MRVMRARPFPPPPPPPDPAAQAWSPRQTHQRPLPPPTHRHHTRLPPPILPAINASSQTLGEDGQLTIDSVTAPESGWLVIHAQAEDGTAGDVLGYVPIGMGGSSGLAITIDPLEATPTLIAMLHIDAGTAGEFEFPGADMPWEMDGVAVAASFAVTIQFDLPTLAVSDQAVGNDGLVRVDSVYATEPGWLAIHADDDGTPGALLGYVYLAAGLHEDVPITLPWRETPPDLTAVLYSDAGQLQHFDYLGDDVPVVVNGGDIVAQSFHASLPPDIFVIDQPFVNGEIVVERVLSDGPGWLVVHYDDGGDLGLIIGFVPLADGVNEDVVVPLVETAVTPELHLMLHDDEAPLGEFDFPGGDPQRMYDGRVMDPVTFRINPGNALFTADQMLQPGEEGSTAVVTIPLVLADIDTWVVLRRDNNGAPGDMIGHVWVPAGVNRDIMIKVDPQQVTDTLYAILHHDADSDQNFDYPEGGDQPLQRNRHVIQVPFKILENGD
ncbi:MAG: hypothetical protein H6662_15825 [Ardenticatenaceae bacterium]|nr:hypothetical protein [Ardenticatenaceae bacterium]